MPEQIPNRPPRRTTGDLIAGGVILCLFLMRFFLVAESAGQGETLWIVALWILGLSIWGVVSWRSFDFSFGWLDLCVGLLAGGHIASALAVMRTVGDKRWALNLAWEWLGIAVGWFLLRQECRQFAFRREMLIGLIATGTAVAGQGLYQHYVEFPQLAAKYGPLFDQLKQADPTNAARIRKMMADDGIPNDGPGVVLFEKRLRDSREPMGLFALANTLGGFLAVCLILAVSVAASTWRPDNLHAWKRLWPWIPIIVLLGWCLLLTKSRTAWLGTAAGLAIWSFGTRRVKPSVAQMLGFAGSLILLAFVGWGLSRFGGLDRQVLTEAPKSLQYRLQYWSATWPMIQDHFWLGVGPGQFRTSYLFYKLPEASEEIADPHNLFFDVAANGGLIALVGLVGLLAILAFQFRRRQDDASGLESPPDSLIVLYVTSGIAAIVWVLLLFIGVDDRLLVLVPVAVALLWGLRRLASRSPDDPQAVQVGSAAAAFGLVVHLLGAGGIGMPAISLLLLGLAALADRASSSSTKPRLQNSMVLPGTFIASSVGLFVALYVTALRPVMVVRDRLAAGDRLVEQGFLDGADAEYLAATAADDLSEEPWGRRAELAYRRAETDRFRSNDSFLNAVRLMREACLRDPANSQNDRRLGNWWIARWRVTSDLKDAQEAVAAFERAWVRYPTNSMLMAELAFALDATGNAPRAREIAGKALKQDSINHEKRHEDRYLADPIRTRLGKLATSPTERSGG